MFAAARRVAWEWTRTARAATLAERFVTEAPRPQHVADIFSGGWASKLPVQGVVSGQSNLFEDERVRWFIEACKGVQGRSILELGPLEGGHSWMLAQNGAAKVVAIESNTRAWLKCLATKELLGMPSVQFLLGDFMKYLEEPGPKFDACLACGVLYHLRDPHLLFPLLRKRVDGPVMVWTAVWSDEIPRSRKTLALRFSTQRTVALSNGSLITLHRHEYGINSAMRRFWGGNGSYSEWMTKEDLEAAADAGGYRVVGKAFDDPNHANSPAVAYMLEPR